MHEIPPMRHREREIEVDLHHTILPLTSRLNPRAEELLKGAIEITGSDYRVLAPTDMVLHSAAHLFQDGEIAGSLRDLVDINDLVKHFGDQASFWSDLMARADLLNLTRPLFYALHFSHKLLGTAVPPEALSKSPGVPNALARAFMDVSVTRVLATHHADRSSAPVAKWLLYVRSHWLRMPPRLLIPHLARKQWRRIRGESK